VPEWVRELHFPALFGAVQCVSLPTAPAAAASPRRTRCVTASTLTSRGACREKRVGETDLFGRAIGLDGSPGRAPCATTPAPTSRRFCVARTNPPSAWSMRLVIAHPRSRSCARVDRLAARGAKRPPRPHDRNRRGAATETAEHGRLGAHPCLGHPTSISPAAASVSLSADSGSHSSHKPIADRTDRTPFGLSPATRSKPQSPNLYRACALGLRVSLRSSARSPSAQCLGPRRAGRLARAEGSFAYPGRPSR